MARASAHPSLHDLDRRSCTSIFKGQPCLWRLKPPESERRPDFADPGGTVDNKSGNDLEINEKEKESEETETWDFDADTYTLVLVHLVKHGVQGSMKALLIVLATLILQSFVFVKLYMFLSKKGSGDERLEVEVIAVCAIMAALVLSGEVRQGLHKIIFSVRGFTGRFANVACKKVLFLSLLLGCFQMLTGICSFIICIELVLRSTDVVDAFMNFIALSFVAELDNAILSSALGKEFFQVEESLEMVRVKDFDTKMGCHERKHLWVSISVAVVGFAIPVSGPMCEFSCRTLDPPVQMNWLSILPAVLIAAGMISTFLVCYDQRSGPFTASIATSVICCLCFYCILILRTIFGTPIIPPLVSSIFWGYLVILIPTALALQEDERLFRKILVPHILVLLVTSVFWFAALQKFGCL